MKLATLINNLAIAAGTAHSVLKNRIGNMANLTTPAKTNLVDAINEAYTLAQNAVSGAGAIDDAAGSGATTVTWSAGKTADAVAAAAAAGVAAAAAIKAEILGGVGPAFDTLVELADKMTADGSLVLQIISDLAKRVRVDAAQAFTGAERLQAQENLGLGDCENTDFAAAFTAAASV